MCRTANALNSINQLESFHKGAPEKKEFGTPMVTGIDGHSPGMVEAQFRFQGGHAHKFAINKCQFQCC